MFLAEYAGPFITYLLFYPQPALVYGSSSRPVDISVQYIDQFNKAMILFIFAALSIAMACWSLHYIKRLLETLFVHRFSHATMPLRNLFKVRCDLYLMLLMHVSLQNCGYYWGFAAFVSYFINHPLYSPPSEDYTFHLLLYTGTFLLCRLWCCSNVHWLDYLPGMYIMCLYTCITY